MSFVEDPFAPATGRYEDYIINEIVPFVDKNYNISEHAVWGKSSGGYGAIVLGMRHPEIFHAVAEEMQPLNTATFLISKSP
jgi:enterochelin esterase-like enzyme